MDRPRYVYLVYADNHAWIPCYYNIQNVKDEGIQIAIEKGFSEEELYWDETDGSLYLWANNMTPDYDDPIVTAVELKVEDA